MPKLCVVLLSALAVTLPSATLAAESASSQIATTQRLVPLEQLLCAHVLAGQMFEQTELFFGLSRRGGPDVSDQEFREFLDREVTPRFPDGLTLLSGFGQFKDSTGAIVKEGSRLLILLYPFSRTSSELVEEIRTEYKTQFQQESVLRVDEQSCVSF
jgi:hypothetical protein